MLDLTNFSVESRILLVIAVELGVMLITLWVLQATR
jgi:hypothetical protein